MSWYKRLPALPQTTLTLHKLNGERLGVDCRKDDLIAAVKKKVQDRYDIPEDRQVLVAGGTELQDYRSLASYGLTSEEGVECALDLVIVSKPLYVEEELELHPDVILHRPPVWQGYITKQEWLQVWRKLPCCLMSDIIEAINWSIIILHLLIAVACLGFLLICALEDLARLLNFKWTLQLLSFEWTFQAGTGITTFVKPAVMSLAVTVVSFSAYYKIFLDIYNQQLRRIWQRIDQWQVRRALCSNNAGAGFFEGRGFFLPSDSPTEAVVLRYYLTLSDDRV